MSMLTPVVSSQPPNFGMGDTYSWVTIENDADRTLFARAVFVSNMSDLSISLSASDIQIGAVEIKDGTSNLRADVTSIAGGANALRVLTQDLDSKNDSVAIGDLSGNIVEVNTSLSALNVFVANSKVSVGTANSSNWDIVPAIATVGSFNSLPVFSCSMVTIFNSASAAIYLKKTGSSFAMPLQTNSSVDINVISNANEISVSSTTTDELTASAKVTKF